MRVLLWHLGVVLSEGLSHHISQSGRTSRNIWRYPKRVSGRSCAGRRGTQARHVTANSTARVSERGRERILSSTCFNCLNQMMGALQKLGLVKIEPGKPPQSVEQKPQ